MDDAHIRWQGTLDWNHLSEFLGRRSIPEVERFDGDTYVRGAVRVKRDGRRRALVVSGTYDEGDLVRVRRLFNVDADSAVVAAHLGRDPLLAPVVGRHRGIRVPGGWDPFEIVVRAMAGQQISVAAARSLVSSIALDCGERRHGRLEFPTAERVASAKLRVGMPRRRLEAIRQTARMIAEGEFVLERKKTLAETIAALESLPGVGPWTANYIAMRALGETDAFPAGDLILRRASGKLTERQLLEKAEAWRPWRAYAAMLLWAK